MALVHEVPVHAWFAYMCIHVVLFPYGETFRQFVVWMVEAIVLGNPYINRLWADMLLCVYSSYLCTLH